MNTSGNSDKRHFPLRIERMPDGGFVVSEASFGSDPSRFCGPLFASSSIGEALAFIAGRLDPEAFKALQEQQAKAAHDAKVAEVSRDFAKAREASPNIHGDHLVFCNTCGVRLSLINQLKSPCVACGRGVGLREGKNWKSSPGDWAGA